LSETNNSLKALPIFVQLKGFFVLKLLIRIGFFDKKVKALQKIALMLIAFYA
jgi:hypothetical protein